jgi:hypothetical protein
MSGEKEEKFYEEEEEEEDRKCPPNHLVSRSNPNEVHKKSDESLFCEEEEEDTKCPPQQDEEDIVMEKVVLSEEREQIKGATDGHVVSGSDPYEWQVSDEARNVAHGTSGGHVVSALRGPDNSLGAESVESHAHHPDFTSKRRSRAARPPIRPGAQRVDGPGNSGLEDDTFTVIIGGDEEVTIETSPPTLTAQLVNREEEERRAKQEVIRNSIVADVIPNVAPDNSSRRWKFAGAFLVLIVVAIVLAVTLRPEKSSPVPSRSPGDLRKLLSSVSSDEGEALSTNSTPQSKAFKWIVTNNTNLGNFSEEIIIQRYALATLFYSTNGDSWSSSNLWLDNGEECERWQSSVGQLVCTDTGAAYQLDLSSNNLSGKLPPEIGLLTSLGECVHS